MSDTLDLQPGQIFAGWRIERELARGGMGVLYLAHHPRLPRTDVIKVLSPMLSTDQRFRERFLREVTRMSTLSHPHLMTIHDSGESETGILYLVMPFISGGDLRALLKRGGPLPPSRAARIITQLGAALDAAHRVGVVHRDVKPENVLLAAVEPDDTDHAVLTDFGISREDMASNTLTATGELLLTPAYASPEQVLGQVVDARADQYALACILYELLTGEPPYRNDVQVVMLMAHVQEPIPRIGGRFGLPRAIDDVIARGMAKTAAERFPNCRALAQAATAALGVTADVQRTPEARGDHAGAPAVAPAGLCARPAAASAPVPATPVPVPTGARAGRLSRAAAVADAVLSRWSFPAAEAHQAQRSHRPAGAHRRGRRSGRDHPWHQIQGQGVQRQYERWLHQSRCPALRQLQRAGRQGAGKRATSMYGHQQSAAERRQVLRPGPGEVQNHRQWIRRHDRVPDPAGRRQEHQGLPHDSPGVGRRFPFAG